MSDEGPMRVAIIGGGLGGLALANALVHPPPSNQRVLDHPGFDVHVYEAKSSFSERGAAVGLSGNAKKALRYCLPSANDMLQKAGAVLMLGSVVLVGSGKNAGAEIMSAGLPDRSAAALLDQEHAKLHDQTQIEQKDDARLTVVHRASLLRGLKTCLEQESHGRPMLHTNRKLTHIAKEDKKVHVTFQDGTVETFDAVIGADGYRGAVRDYVLGDKAGEEAVSLSSFWDCRTVVPMETAKEVFFKPLREALRARAQTEGDRLKVDRYFGTGDSFDCPRQWAWMGNTGFVMHDVCENGTKLHCVISPIQKEPWIDRKLPLTRDTVIQHMEGWMDGPVLPAMLDLMFAKGQPAPGNLDGYSQWHHKTTSTYNNGRICIMGDAAHATTPWQGAGAGMAFEDAMVLSHLLWTINSRHHIAAVFETFTEVRIDRCQHIIDSSAGTGMISCGLCPELGDKDPDTGVLDLEPAKVAAALAKRWERIRGIDHEDHRNEARRNLEERIIKIQA